MARTSSEEPRRRLFDVAGAQAGYFTAEQALTAGYSRRLHTYHTNRGHWFRTERGIYRLREFPPSKNEDLVRWSLWSGNRAVISHDTAAAFHELGDVLPSRVHLTVPPGFRRRIPPGAVIHRASLARNDAQEAGGFQVTTPMRTIVDLVTSDMESDWLASVVRDALTRGAVRAKDLEARFATLEERYRDRAFRLLRPPGRRPLEV